MFSLTTLPLLSIQIFLPLLGAIFIAFIRPSAPEVGKNAKMVAFVTSVAGLCLSFVLYYNFDPSTSGFQFVEKQVWWPEWDMSYHLGVDGISLPFIILTALLTPLAILASWETASYKPKEFMIAFLVLESFVMGVFCALDLVLFYVFFEAVLIPMFLIIGIWGGTARIQAAFKFFLYTLLGSLLMLVGILTMFSDMETMDITQALVHNFTPQLQIWLWLAFFASFAVKIPMWPFHTWLPYAHVEAPTSGSVMLAGILLKMGGYGFLRFSLPMFPLASEYFAPLVLTLSVVAIIYASLVAYVQEDMKKLIAYSSVAHMGIVTLGIFSLTEQGIQGALIQMLSHGVVSAALFLCVGVIYDRLHTREIKNFQGLVTPMPKYAVALMVFTCASFGLPGTSGFVGEVLGLAGAFIVYPWFATFAAVGAVLSALYMLYLYKRIVFGKFIYDNQSSKALMDLTLREKLIFIPLILLTIIGGIYPKIITDLTKVPVLTLLQQINAQTHTNPVEQVSKKKHIVAQLKQSESRQQEAVL